MGCLTGIKPTSCGWSSFCLMKKLNLVHIVSTYKADAPRPSTILLFSNYSRSLPFSRFPTVRSIPAVLPNPSIHHTTPPTKNHTTYPTMHHLLQLAAFLAATLTCTTGSPLPQENALTPNPLNILHKREDSYDCSGSSNCIGVNVLRDCDDAVNGLSRGTDSKIYSASAHDGGQVVGVRPTPHSLTHP